MIKKENLINQEVKEYNTIMFIFDIKFVDFVDIFTFKKSLEDILNDYKINKNDINCTRIKDNIIGINEIATDVINKNEGNYFSFFILNISCNCFIIHFGVELLPEVLVCLII